MEAGRARGAGGVRSFRSSDADRKLKEGNREALQREEEVIWVLYQLSVCVVCAEQEGALARTLEPLQNVSGVLCPVSALACGASESAWCGRKHQS